MPPIVEPLSGGLVTSRDASLLQPGELSVAEDVMLLPSSPSLRKAYGRTAFGDSPVQIDGVTYADFDTADDKVVIVGDESYYIAPADEVGAITFMADGAGSSLDSVSTSNKVVLFSGGAVNRVLLPDGSSRPHGMQPVTTAPGAVHTATGGTWPLGANELGFYEYWTTEAYITDDDDVESTFTGTPATVNVTATTSHVTISRPSIVTPEATHWRIYRSNSKTSFFDQAFPSGFLIADVPINTLSFEDGISTTTALTLPTTASTPTDTSNIIGGGQHEVVSVLWSNPANVLLDDAATAISGAVSTTSFGHEQAGVITVSQIMLENFGLTGIGEPITDIQVQVEGSRSSATLVAYLSWDGGDHWTSGQTIPLTSSNSTVIISGGTWGRTWSAAELANASFKVRLIAWGPVNSGTGTVTIDFAKVAATHGGTSAARAILFPSIELIVGGESTAIGSNYPPPRSSTGDLFQGSILMNDLDAPTNIAWTIPGTLDYTPILYRMALDDRVICIRALGSSCIIGCKSSCVRMNYLPVAEDPEFNTGRAVDLIDSDDGVAGYKAAIRFVLAGELMLFYVGQTSLKMTNAFNTTSATDDITWTELVDIEHLDECFVENNTRNHELLVFFPSLYGVNKILRLSYDEAHIKNGKLKVVGITNFAATAATSGVPNAERLVYTTTRNTMYVENRGLVDGSGGTIIPRITTREMHQAGVGNSWELVRFGVHHQGGGGTIASSVNSSLSNYPTSSGTSQKHEMADRTTTLIDNAAAGDGITINITGTDDGLPMTLDYLVLYPAEMDESAPLKR